MARQPIIQTYGTRQVCRPGGSQVAILDGVDFPIDGGEFVAGVNLGDIVATGSGVAD
jgi:hypothetical protein